MAEKDLTFPGWISPHNQEEAALPGYAQPYAYVRKYDLDTALYQGTLFPWLDDHWRRRVQKAR